MPNEKQKHGEKKFEVCKKPQRPRTQNKYKYIYICIYKINREKSKTRVGGVSFFVLKIDLLFLGHQQVKDCVCINNLVD